MAVQKLSRLKSHAISNTTRKTFDIERLAKELHGEVDKNGNDDDFDPYAEGNYITRK